MINEWLKQHRELCFLTLALLTLLVAGSIYVLYRQSSLVMFGWFNAIGMTPTVEILRSQWGSNSPNGFWLYSFPDALWMISYLLIVNAVMKPQMGVRYLFFVSLLPVLAMAHEVMQGLGLMRGVFDPADFLCYLIPYLINIIYYFYHEKLFDWRTLSLLVAGGAFVVLAAGSLDEPKNGGNQDENEPTAGEVLNIPEDEDADPAPTVTNPTTNIANPSINIESKDGYTYVSIDLTGVWDQEASDWLELYGTGESNQNVWVTVDGTPKGIDVYNNSSGDGQTLIADVVFLVDNSGSMYEEAEAVSNSILAWSELLAASGLDLHVGCVGYGDSYYAIDGAFNMNQADALKEWMEANGYGTDRTHTFGGDDANDLQDLARSGNYDNGSYNECGMVALHFAHDNFNFRSGSNRIYVNFTDEPNQPNGNEKWSVEYLNPENNNWQSNFGTVHTVFSEDEDYYEYYWNTPNLYNEKPWLMSEYTGGTMLFTDRNFTDFTLENLPVTGAMQNSYVIRFTNIDNLFDGNDHVIVITIYSPDGTVQAEKTIIFNFGTL